MLLLLKIINNREVKNMYSVNSLSKAKQSKAKQSKAWIMRFSKQSIQNISYHIIIINIAILN